MGRGVWIIDKVVELMQCLLLGGQYRVQGWCNTTHGEESCAKQNGPFVQHRTTGA
jgi:hypothetical protein